MRALLLHPNIVGLRDTYEDAKAVHLVMGICQGEELFDTILARGHYTERAVAVVCRTIVELCHEHGVMHRDLKLENFLFANVEETSSLKLIYFGLSVCFKPGSLGLRYHRMQRTLPASRRLESCQSMPAHFALGISRDELFGQFYAALNKIYFFATTTDGEEDHMQLTKATYFFEEALLGCCLHPNL